MLRVLIIAVLCLTAVSALPTFEEYLHTHQKKYPDAEEFATRKALYEAEVERLESHDASWTVGVNKFSDMTPEEKSRFLGYRHTPSTTMPRQTAPAVPHDYPESIDWIAQGATTAIKDQGQCGSCWAFSATEAIESYYYLSTGKLLELAPQQLVDCVQNPDECGGTGGCEGATFELAFGYIIEVGGFAAESSYPYKAQDGTCQDQKVNFVANITSSVQAVSNDYDSVMQAIQTGPVSVSVDAASWFSYSSGIYDGCNQESPDIDHAVQLVGYGVDNGQNYWTIRNSWGESWGEKGTIRLKRNDPSDTPCGTDSTPLDGVGCQGGPPTVEVCGTCGVLFDVAYPVV